ncbi:MAG: hypothetical protein JST26_18830 [Bacteroidetes bacterium]|nr:hypothetical protein [Bacteroidota bacterium]
MLRYIALIFITICISIHFSSCKKDKLLTDSSAKVVFSQDSVLFDTVFTTIGSTTRNIRIINKNKQKIKVSSVYLEQGQSSPFTLNVDGSPGKSFSDIEIPANDSIFVFIQVNVNPTNQNSPLVITDRIMVNVNGNEEHVKLEAWGQDAYYHMPNKAIQYQNGFLPYSTVSTQTNVTVTWNNDKPHVVYGWLVVDSTQKLVINQGVRVYFHQNAGLWVFRYGTLQVNGLQGQEVTFQGDRRESDYADLPGQWDRIWINEGSNNNYINYAKIKNSYIGIQAESIYGNPADPGRLKVTNTVVQNCSKWGLYAVGYKMFLGNSIIMNCKEYCAAFTVGGTYTAINTTFANYWNQDGGRGGQPCVHIDNYYVSGGVNHVVAMDSAYFGNCIITGSQSNELEIDVKTSALPLSYTFSYSMLTTTNGTANSHYDNCRITPNANFEDPANYYMKPKSTSAAIDMGTGAYQNDAPYSFLSTDITGSGVRNIGTNVDAGAYEVQ